MLLNYSIPDFSFIVGTEDLTNYIDSWLIESPLAEFSTPQLLTGQFTLSRNKKALEDSRSESFFSEFSNPGLWFKGQNQVKITVKGKLLPIMRIDKYKWNKRTQTGSATLVQLPMLFSIFANKALALVEPRVGGTSLTQIVSLLLAECKKQYSGFLYDVPNLEGTFDQTVYFDDAIGLCQNLAGKQQYFMWCDHTERLRWVRYGSSANFTLIKSIVEYEDDPNLDGIDFFAEVVKVAGTKEVAKLPELEPEPEAENLPVFSSSIEYDDDGYVQSFRKIEKKTYGEVFRNITDLDGNGLLSQGQEDTSVVSLIENHYFTYGQYSDGSKYLIRELISVQKLQGELYGDLVDNNDNPLISSLNLATPMVFAETVEITAQYQKTTLTKGQIYAGLLDTEGLPIINSLGLAAQPVTFVQYLDGEVSAKPPYFVPEKDRNPNTGEQNQVQPDPVKEAPQEKPALEFTTEVYLGVCRAYSIGFNTFLPKELPLDVGFLPSQAVADRLACFIKDLELSRRNGMIYTMPVQDSWLARNGEPFLRAYLDDAIGWIDGWSIGMANKQCQFSFALNRVGTGVPVPIPPNYAIQVNNGLRIILNSTNFYFVQGEAIAPYQFQALGGVAPYSWTIASSPAGLNLTSGGLLSGTPTASATTAATVQVQDAASTIQIVNITFYVVNPAIVGNQPYGELLILQSRTAEPHKISTAPKLTEILQSRTSRQHRYIDHKFWYQAGKGVSFSSSNFVSAWADQSGHGYDLLQAVVANQPKREIFFAEVPPNLRPLMDMGSVASVSKFLKTANLGTHDFTLKTLYMAIYQYNWTLDSYLLSDNREIASSSGGQYGVIQKPTSARLAPKVGITGAGQLPAVDASLGVWRIVTIVVEDTNVKIRLNKNSIESVISTTSDNWVFGATSALLLNGRGRDVGGGEAPTNFAEFAVSEIIGRDSADDENTQNGIIDDLARRIHLAI